MKRPLLLPLVLIGFVFIRTSSGQSVPDVAIEIPLTVTEPVGVTRTAGHVTTGVPIPSSAAQSAWSLFQGNQEIPVQTTLLPGLRTPWVLLDFPSTVTAGATESYTLRSQTPTVTPVTSLVVTEAPTTSTINTGPLKVVINKSQFNVFDEVWYDRDANGTFGPTEQVVTPTVNDNLPLRQGVNGSGTGATLTGRGTPQSYTWETFGPLRSTLRVDGVYGDPQTPFIGYTMRLTFIAGSPSVTIEHLLRNSVAGEERYAKVQSAQVIIGAGGSTLRPTKSGSTLWANVDATGVRLDTIPPTLDVSTVYPPGGSRQNTAIDVDANGGMIIGDWSYHGVTTQLDFREGLTPTDRTNASATFNDRLVALAPASWYSEMGAFGTEKFGTLDDEKQSYQRWGWTWPTPGNPYSNDSTIPRVKNTYRADWNTLNAGDLEADDVWMNMLMYARTGSRGYLDRADGIARYWKWEYAWRTDEFSFLRNDYWSGPDRYVDFPRVDLPANSFTANDQLYVTNNVKYGKNDGNHSWGSGLFDYYYMFGDMDAYAAATDIAEQARQHSIWTNASAVGVIGGNVRGQARQLMNVVRAWEATGNQLWRTAADHLRDMFLSPTAYYDARGFYYGLTNETTMYNVNLRYPNARYLAPFMQGAATQALYRYLLVTGDTSVRQRILEMATFAMTSGTNAQGYTGDNVVVDYPTAGNVIHMSYDQFRNDNPVTLFPYSGNTATYIDTLTIAYRLTGDAAYLTKAKAMWDRTSKRLGVNPYTNLIADATHVGRFMNSLLNNNSAMLYPENGDLTTAHMLFYDASRLDEIAPSNITNLRAQ